MTARNGTRTDATGVRGHGRRALLHRLALRDIRRNVTRFALAALVIAITIGAGTGIDILLRSAEATDATYAHLSLGDTAEARVQWYGDSQAQQTPRADAAVAGGRDATATQVETQLRTLLPTGSELVETRSGVLALRSGASLTDGVSALEGSFTDPALVGLVDVWQGRLPETAGEVSVSRSLAERLNLSAGDTFEGGTTTASELTPLVLVGIHENNPLGNPLGFDVALADGTLLRVGSSYLAGAPSVWFVTGSAVTWNEVLALNDAGFVAVSRAVVLDPPSASEVPIYRDGAAYEADVRFGVAILVTVVLLVGGTIVALLVGPVFAIGARRSRRDYGLLAAQGATGRDITGVMLRSTLVTAIIGAVSGGLLGTAVGTTTVWVAQATGSTAFPNLIVPALDLLLLVVFGVVVALVAAWAPARRAAREDPIASLKDTADSSGTAPRTRWVLMTVLTVVAVAVIVAALVSEARVWLVVAGPLLTVVLILAVRAVLPLLGRVARALPTPERIAIRDAVRRADRTIPTVTGTVAAVALAVAIMVVTATQFATAAAEWHPRAAEGTLMIYDGVYTESSGGENPFETSMSEREAGEESTITTQQQRAQITATIDQFLPGTELIDVTMLSLRGDPFPKLLIDPDVPCPAWADFTKEYNEYIADSSERQDSADVNGLNCQIDKPFSDLNRQPLWDSTDHTNLVVDDGTLVTALGLPGAEEAAEALRSGQIVLTRPIDLWPDGTARLGILEEDHQAEARWVEKLEQSEERGERFYENPPEPVTMDSLTADAIVMDWRSQQWQAFIPPQLLTQTVLADFDPVVEKVGMIATAGEPLSQEELDELRDRLLLLDIHQVTAARDYSNPGLATTLTIVTVLASLIAITATAGTARIALNDMRRDLRILHDVGAPRNTRRRIRVTASLAIGALGSIVGVLVGIVLGVTTAASIANSDAVDKGSWALTVPWLPVVLIAIATPLAAVALTATRHQPDASD